MKKNVRRADQKHTNVLVMVVIACVVIAIAVFLGGRLKVLKASNSKEQAEITQAKKELEKEQERATKLEEYGKYVNTIPFYEEVARNVFGLVYPDEKVIVSED